MEEINPLIFVAIAYVLLWSVGKVFASPSLAVKPEVEKPVEKKQRGVKFAPGLRVLGLDAAGVENLKLLIKEYDEERLAHFIAYYRPNFIELEVYFNILRGRFLGFLEKPIEVTSEIEKISAANRVLLTDHPKNIDIKTLNSPELRNLYAFEPMKPGAINREFIDTFGDEGFIELFKSYMEIRDPKSTVTIYVPETDPKRKTIDKLLDTGLIQRGRKLTLEQRLNVLDFGQIKDMARNMKIEEEPTNKQEGIRLLADHGGSATTLSMIYEIEDIFKIEHKEYYEDEINMEWTACKAYAKVLCNPTGNIE